MCMCVCVCVCSLGYRSLCNGGCGVERCSEAKPLASGKIGGVSIGQSTRGLDEGHRGFRCQIKRLYLAVKNVVNYRCRSRVEGGKKKATQPMVSR